MNVLEEYLVKIGADIDRNAFNGANQAINQLAGAFRKLGSAMKYAGLLAAIAKLTEAVTQNIKAVADADMEYQKLAKTMWVTKETAKSLTMVTKTMGASAEDIAWVPELREQFFRLREEMNALQTPGDADGQLRWIREIGYDVQSLQLKLKMLREWIVYYLIKYLRPYIEELQQFIRWLGEKLGSNMPAIARRLARVLSSVVSLGVSALRLIKNVYEAISEFIGALPEKTKKMVAVFALAGAAIMSGPFGMFMVALGAGLLLLQDFFYYLDGKKSSRNLAPMWRWLMNADNPLRKLLNTIVKGLESILKNLTEIFEKAFTPERQKALKKAVDSIKQGLVDIAATLDYILNKIFGNGKDKVRGFWDFFGKQVQHKLDMVIHLGTALGKLMQGVAKLGRGDVTGAIKDFLGAGEEAVEAAKHTFIGQAALGMRDIITSGQNEKTVYDYFVGQGLSPEAAAGFVGNFMQESGINPADDTGDDGTSGGIAQWHSERWQALKDYASSQGTDWRDLLTQLNFVMHELRTTEREAYLRLLQAETPEEAARIISKYFERPDPESANNEQRSRNARDVYDAYANSGGSSLKFFEGSTEDPNDPFHLSKLNPFRRTSYAASLATGGGYVPYGGNTYNGGTINVGSIVINCQNSQPKAVAAAVQDKLLHLRAEPIIQARTERDGII